MTVIDERREKWKRLGRLTLKELREILRDRRTIVTLVLMPLMLYPLLSIAFQKLLLTGLGARPVTRFAIGMPEDQAEAITGCLHLGDQETSQTDQEGEKKI